MPPSDVSWAPIVAERFEAAHITALLDQRAPCLVIPGYLKTDWCAEVTKRFEAYAAAHPTHRVRIQPNAAVDLTLDTTVFPLSFFAQSRPVNLAPYLAGVERDRPALRALYAGGPDPLEVVRGSWREIGWTELPPSEGGRPFHTDLLWGLTGRYRSVPHVDTYHSDVPALAHFTSRLNFDVFLRAPASSISYRFYDKFRGAEDTVASALVSARTYDHTAQEGELVVYNAAQYYEILSPDEQGLRLLTTMAAGVDALAREFALFA